MERPRFGVGLPQPNNSYTSLKAQPLWPLPQETLPLTLSRAPIPFPGSPLMSSTEWIHRRLWAGCVCPLTDAPPTVGGGGPAQTGRPCTGRPCGHCPGGPGKAVGPQERPVRSQPGRSWGPGFSHPPQWMVRTRPPLQGAGVSPVSSGLTHTCRLPPPSPQTPPLLLSSLPSPSPASLPLPFRFLSIFLPHPLPPPSISSSRGLLWSTRVTWRMNGPAMPVRGHP